MFKHKAVTSSVTLAGIIFLASTQIELHQEKTRETTHVAASVSVCMEANAVADKIEITKTSIKKASIVASGISEFLPADESATCDIKLV